MPRYVLDSNFFIEAHRRSYPFDVAVGFWAKVEEMANNGDIISIDKVQQELYKNADPLSQWCQEHLPGGFFEPTAQCIAAYTNVVQWASAKPNMQPIAIANFIEVDSADAWLVSYSLHNNHTLVTFEQRTPNALRIFKIPDVCDQFNVSVIEPMDLFRNLNQTF